MSVDLTMALAAADETPRIAIDYRQILRTAGRKGIVKVIAESSGLVPRILRIAKEHAQEMATAGLAICATIGSAGMHDAQVVDELDVTLAAPQLGAEALGQLLDGVQGMQLLVRQGRHAGIALDQWSSQQRRLDELTHWPAL